ncbi:hypothetical protein M378DRAFT_11591, partial [Amanita muscaria Koide BX008]
ARLHWGQYLTPSFNAQEYKEKDPKFATNIATVRKIADKYDPAHMMTNSFLDQVVFSTSQVTPSSSSLSHLEKEPKFSVNITAVRKFADKYDPTHMMTNSFLDQVVFSTLQVTPSSSSLSRLKAFILRLSTSEALKTRYDAKVPNKC